MDLIDAWCLTPAASRVSLHGQMYWNPISSIQAVRFLKHLLCQQHWAVILVWDSHPIHKRKIVSQFLSHYPRVDSYFFPSCTPELNPMEFVWTQVSEATANPYRTMSANFRPLPVAASHALVVLKNDYGPASPHPNLCGSRDVRMRTLCSQKSIALLVKR